VIRCFDQVFPVALGSEGDGDAEALQRQHCQLANWRENDAMLDYRRFRLSGGPALPPAQ